MYINSWKVSSIVSSFSYWLRKIWNAWDVRVMVLLSLLFQIVLFMLGKRRKHSQWPFSRMILWFAYITADWVAIVALGKLSNSFAESPTTNVLRALWAPLLILHLGGPDTITAYSFEDNQRWNRHILTLILRSFFAVYVVYLSWTRSWLSFLSLPLIFAGILKYVGRILCLERTSSKKTDPVIPIFDNEESLNAIETEVFLQSFPSNIVLLASLLFLVMRPDINDYLCNKSHLESTKLRLQTHLKKNVRRVDHSVKAILADVFEAVDVEAVDVEGCAHFEVATEILGFIFDVVYTKAGLIYTKKGCFLRLCSFTCSFSVLLLFLVNILNEPKFNFSRVDIYITINLLVGAVALELWAMYLMVSSHWAVPLVLFHDSHLVRKTLNFVLLHLCFLFPQQKKWSGRMGQFNLLDYYSNSRNSKVYGILEKCFSCYIFENRHRFKSNFVEVPRCLKLVKDYQHRLESFFMVDSFKPTRGKRFLCLFDGSLAQSIKASIEASIKLDFDTSIIIWHLATSICYHQDVQHPYRNILIEDKKSSKYLSDYMMYLLAMQPAMLLPAHRTSFWLDACCDNLKELFSKASDMDRAFTLLLKQDDGGGQGNMIRSPKAELQHHTSKLVMELNSQQIWDRWKIIKEIWIEMLLYAAHSCQHVNHVKQLGLYDREFLSLIWVMGVSYLIRNLVMEGY